MRICTTRDRHLRDAGHVAAIRSTCERLNGEVVCSNPATKWIRAGSRPLLYMSGLIHLRRGQELAAPAFKPRCVSRDRRSILVLSLSISTRKNNRKPWDDSTTRNPTVPKLTNGKNLSRKAQRTMSSKLCHEPPRNVRRLSSAGPGGFCAGEV